MILWGLKTCDTCKKARKTLEAAGKSIDYKDVRDDGVPEAELRRFYEALGDDLINRRSTTWKNLNGLERAGDPIELLIKNPTLMKRPVIDTGKSLFLGWKSDVQAAVMGED